MSNKGFVLAQNVIYTVQLLQTARYSRILAWLRARKKSNQVVRYICLPDPGVLSPGQTIATCQSNISQHCWAQHVACVWPPCCNMLGVVGSSLTSFKLKPKIHNMLQQIATQWPNARNMLCPTMLRYGETEN